MAKPKTALVLIHLSSLDAFADYWSVEDPEFKESWSLARRIAQAALAHHGPVVIADQDWVDRGPWCAPRVWLQGVIRAGRPDATWIHFDEEESPWRPFLAKLRKMLERLKIKKVIVGGVWFDPGEWSGCVTATYQYLKKYFDVTVASDLVVCDKDVTPWSPELWTYEKALQGS